VQYHRHQWCCDWPHDRTPDIRVFSSANELQEHLVQDHRNLFEEKHLPVLVERGKQYLTILFPECPFCRCKLKDMKTTNETEFNDQTQVGILADKLEKHVGDHIRNFSFFAFLDSNEAEDSMCDQMTAPKSANQSESDSDLVGEEYNLASEETEITFVEDSIPEMDLEVEYENVEKYTADYKRFPAPRDDGTLATFGTNYFREKEQSAPRDLLNLSESEST
jgi:hypothetical protein